MVLVLLYDGDVEMAAIWSKALLYDFVLWLFVLLLSLNKSRALY